MAESASSTRALSFLDLDSEAPLDREQVSLSSAMNSFLELSCGGSPDIDDSWDVNPSLSFSDVLYGDTENGAPMFAGESTLRSSSLEDCNWSMILALIGDVRINRAFSSHQELDPPVARPTTIGGAPGRFHWLRRRVEDRCPICLDVFQRGQKVFTHFCGHHLHAKCATCLWRWTTVCPLCRATFEPTRCV
uniref:RING-type domain-containing protein n=1 Tax=Noctiluca scintillans TaxID=2966 RepID=A0A7S1A4X9_NOCSC|mmetsp:Transcript_30819/g.81868  ORF Transcript_30819/g.81868 Transcript_30819/m.81868 type:complete len:191 (+) Transcript_30819:30-602(+)